METSAATPAEAFPALNRPALRTVIGSSALAFAATGLLLGSVLVDSLPIAAAAGAAAAISAALALSVRNARLYLSEDPFDQESTIISKKAVTLDEVAAHLRVSPSTIYRLLRKRQLPAFKADSESIDRWRAALAEAKAERDDEKKPQNQSDIDAVHE